MSVQIAQAKSTTLYQTSETKKKPNWSELFFWRTRTFEVLKKILGSSSIQPESRLIFRPLIQTPLHKVKVVLIFPRPYFTGSKADGLALSYKSSDGKYDVKEAPETFCMIADALKHDLNIKLRKSDLTQWTRRGVLLWNAIPTVLAGMPNAHSNLGWDKLTKEIIETVYCYNPKAVFVFLGPLDQYADILPKDAFSIRLDSVSPIGYTENFVKMKIFSKINGLLKSSKQKPIDWRN